MFLRSSFSEISFQPPIASLWIIHVVHIRTNDQLLYMRLKVFDDRSPVHRAAHELRRVRRRHNFHLARVRSRVAPAWRLPGRDHSQAASRRRTHALLRNARRRGTGGAAGASRCARQRRTARRRRLHAGHQPHGSARLTGRQLAAPVATAAPARHRQRGSGRRSGLWRRGAATPSEPTEGPGRNDCLLGGLASGGLAAALHCQQLR